MWEIPQWVSAVELGVCGLTLASLVLFLVVLHKYTALNWNCRFLLCATALALMVMTGSFAVEMAVVCFNLTELPDPDDLDNHPFMQMTWTVHEAAYAMSSFLAVFLAIERLLASSVSDYGSRACYNVLTISASVLGLFFSAVFGYLVHFKQMHLPATPAINTIDFLALVISCITLWRCLIRYRSYKTVNLENRFQVDEVIGVSRAVIPALFQGVVLKAIAMTFVWNMIVHDTHVFYYSEVLLGHCILWPWVVMLLNHHMKHHLLYMLSGGTINLKETEMQSMIASISDDGYFKMLREDFFQELPVRERPLNCF